LGQLESNLSNETNGADVAVLDNSTLSGYRYNAGGVLSVLAFCGAWLLSTQAQAIEPESIEWGIFDFTPTLSADFGRDDNIFQRDAEAISSYLGIVAPQVRMSLQNNSSRYSLEVEVMEGLFSHSPQDEYRDWRFSANAYHELNSRNSLNIDINYLKDHENRGSDLTRYSELPDNIILYDQLDYALRYQFGSEDSRGRLVFEYEGLSKEYIDQNNVTTGQDYSRHEYSTAFYYNARSRSQFFVELKRTDIAYQDDQVISANSDFQLGLDSAETYAYLGIDWDASSRLDGSLKVGSSQKQYTARSSSDATGLSYEGQLVWSPLSYSKVALNADQGFDESVGFADGRQRTNTSIRWEHEWSYRLRSVVTLSQLDFDYLGENLTEEYTDLSVGLTLTVARWLDLRVELMRNQLNSTRQGFGFKQNNILVGFNASL